MLLEPTIEKLHELRLGNMADAWQQQQRDAKVGALSFDERFSLLVDAEHQARDNRRLTRLLKDAQLRIPQACVEDVDEVDGFGGQGFLRPPPRNIEEARLPAGLFAFFRMERSDSL